MTPKRAKEIEQMVRNYYTHYKEANITLRQYLEATGLKDDELAYGLGMAK